MRIVNLIKIIIPNIKKENKIKVIRFINLIIFISIFALVSSSLSLIFERKIDILEREIILLEVNNTIFVNQLERTSKNIKILDNFIISQAEKNSLKEMMNSLNSNNQKLTTKRSIHYEEFFLLKQIAEKNNNEIFRTTNEMMLIAENVDDVNFVEKSISQSEKIKSKLDNIISEENEYEAENTPNDDASNNDFDKFYSKYSEFNKSYYDALSDQLKFYFNNNYTYFLKKKIEYQNKVSNSSEKISKLSQKETKTIFYAFLIQVIIFIIIQTLEFSFELKRKKKT